MVSSQKKSFADDISYQFACKEACQVGCTSQLPSFLEMPLYQDISRKPRIADEEFEEVFSQSRGEDSPVGDSMSEMAVISAQENPGSRKSESQCLDHHGSIGSFRSVTSTICKDVGRSEPIKRPPTLDGFPQHPYKRARQAACCDWHVSSEFPLLRAAPLEPLLSVAACNESRGNRDCFYEEHSSNKCASTSGLSWVTCNIREEEHKPELLMPTYSSPCSTVDRGQPSRFIQLEDVYLSIFDYYPRKHVAVGLDHQADIPAWRPRPLHRPSKEFDPGAYLQQMTEEDNNEKFIGTCIIPMPDLTAAALDDAAAHVSSFGCSCPDESSIRCVKQHVNEARERLKGTLGLTAFMEMGLYDMGEYVAQKWTEEEEQAFLEVVATNPASLGRNFWDQLPRVFPSKSSKELVSYYFNVFMLRKRAEQNRLHPINIDSDDDEWQESEEGEVGTEDYESDSVVETPGDQDDAYNNGSHEEYDFHEDDEDGDAHDVFIHVEDHSQEFDGTSKGQIKPKSSYVPRVPSSGVNAHTEDHDIQDDSCTSYEGQHIGVNSAPDPAAEYSGLAKDHGRDVSLSSVMDPGCIVSPDAKAWDRSYFSVQDKGVDFLPTCHVIEEVFGKGSWADESEDGQGVS